MKRKERSAKERVLLALEARWARPLSWLGPAWAALCGAVASGRLGWEGEKILFLLLSLFLGDPLLGTIWREVEALASSSWPPMTDRSKRGFRPPYTLPGSLSARFFSWVGKWLRWWKSFWPESETSIVGLLFALPLALLLAILLGRSVLALVSIAFLLAAVEFLRMRGGGGRSMVLGAIYGGAIAWLVGYSAFQPLSLTLRGEALSSQFSPWLGQHGEALLWAFIYSGVFYAFQRIREREGVRALNLAQIVGVAALISFKEPILAGLAGLFLLPQMLLQPALQRRRRDGSWYLRRIQIFAMLGMMTGAVAVAI